MSDGKVLAGITMSLDGFVTGPADRPGAGLGEGGERLHYWVFGGPWTYEGVRGSADPVDQAYLDEVFSSGGAWIVGRTMHDIVDGWGDDPGFGVPVFVVTHRPHETVVKGDTSFEFVTGGIEDALARAREAAGGKNVVLMGGADLLRQYLDAGLVDEFTLTIAPVLLGGGKRLFDGISQTGITFERTGVIESPFATHLRFRVSSA
ncbi:MAG TPA: dihydrofolate reductase family protein [Candidatus Acidoferrum sp.]|nr:dihydrofolate reductase family protein [Candidatus Acidoferrum sp.]